MNARGPPVDEIGCKFQSAVEIDAGVLRHPGLLKHFERVVARSVYEWDHRTVERVYASESGWLTVQTRYYRHGDLQHVDERQSDRVAYLSGARRAWECESASDAVGREFESAVESAGTPLYSDVSVLERALDRARGALRALAGGERA